MLIDIEEVYLLKPAPFWRYVNGSFSYESHPVNKTTLLIKFTGQAVREDICHFLEMTQWLHKCLKQHYYTGALYYFLDCTALKFVSMNARQELILAFRNPYYLTQVWCFSSTDWTISFWKTLQFLVEKVKINIVTSLEEAQIELKEYEALGFQKENYDLVNDVFNVLWQKELRTFFAGKYLLRYIDFPNWMLEKEKPFFKASFRWVGRNILFIELSGSLTYNYAEELLNKKMEILLFLEGKGFSTVHLVLHIANLSATSIRSTIHLWQYIRLVPIQIHRYVIGSSMVERLKLGRLIGYLTPHFNVEVFTNSVNKAVRFALEASAADHTNSRHETKTKLQLQEEQKHIYESDERFRRQLFSHLSALILNKTKDRDGFESSDLKFANETFHALELLAVDFKETYERLESNNSALHKLRGKTFQQQFNPHFIFNVLNSILACLYEKKNDVADSLLMNFASLMRMVIENAQNETISVETELAFLRNYLEMENVRTDNLIKVDIDIDVTIQRGAHKLFIPPMLIQPFVENAIWNRLMPANKVGLLSISFRKSSNQLICVIQDNGISFQESVEMRKGRSDPTGVRHIAEQIELLNKAYSNTISTEIEQTDQGNKRIVILPTNNE